MKTEKWEISSLENVLPKRFKNRPFWIEFLNRFARCSTYWYIPKVRALNRESLKTAKNILHIIFDSYLDLEWNSQTEELLHNELVQKAIIRPTSDPSVAKRSDVTALVRIYKKWLEILGLAYIESKYWSITDAGLDLLSQKRPNNIITNQIYRFQFPDGIESKEGQWGRITPIPFILEILRLFGQIDHDEWILFINLAQRNEDFQIISKLITEWRILSDNEKAKIMKVASNIPIALEQEKDVFGMNVVFNHSGRRYNRIKLNSSYQMSFFGYPEYISVSKGRMKLNENVKTYNFPDFSSITPIEFQDQNDWFAYYGDPTKKPEWIEAIKFKLLSASNKMEAKYILEKAKRTLKTKVTTEVIKEREEIERIYFEKFVEEFYQDNLSLIEDGLKLYEEKNSQNNTISGRQYTTSIGRMDLLCVSLSGDFVVIEIKKDNADDEAIGQLLRYIGWIYKHKSKNVRGVLLAGGFSDKTKYAKIGVIRNGDVNFLKLLKYQIKPEEVV